MTMLDHYNNPMGMYYDQASYYNSLAALRSNFGASMIGYMNTSPQAVKKRSAHTYAAEVRARKPEMQVKRIKDKS